MPVGDGLQRPAPRQPALFHRAVGHGRRRPLRQRRQQVELRAAANDIVEHLVGGAAGSSRPGQLRHVVGVEVADAPGGDLSGRLQRLHAFHRLGQGHGASPVQQIEVQPVGAQPLQARLAGPGDTAAPGVLGIDLADEENLLAEIPQRLAQEALRGALAVHLGGVDQAHAELDPQAQSRRFHLAPAGLFAHPPGALAEHGNTPAIRQRDRPHLGRSEGSIGHGRLRAFRRLNAAPTANAPTAGASGCSRAAV